MLAVIVLFLTLGTSLHTPMIGAYTHDVLQVKMSFLALLFPAPALLAGIALWKFGAPDRPLRPPGAAHRRAVRRVDLRSSR